MAKAAWKYHPGKISDDCADMYVADLDGDGRGEVLSTSAHNYGFWWHRPEGDAAAPTFKTETLDKTIFETHSANYVDLDGDGRRELVTGQRFGAHGFKDERAPSELVWYELSPQKDGPPKATLHVVDDQSGVGAQFVTTDVDGDGRQDIVVSNRKGVFLFRQKKEAK